MSGIPVEFVLFGLTLAGVAVFHRFFLPIALSGLAAIAAYKLAFTGFKYADGLAGLGLHLQHEWVILANLLLLLLGFAILSRHFEKSHVPANLPKVLPEGWLGPFLMLVVIFVVSGFLDNIAGALIGGAMAHALFRGKVHVGFIVGIVAAANAGGAGSVIGDTTTTMMWIAGVDPRDVLHAYLPSTVALIVFGIPAAWQQQSLSPMIRPTASQQRIDWHRVHIVALMLGAAVVTNITVNMHWPEMADRFPFLGAVIWLVIFASVRWRRPDWEILPETFKSTLFLLALVLCASMMPVDRLPAASPGTTFGLGFLSAAFDNIPLTALALKQGGYDWGFLAYAVGFGGSMVWFGSSAGVALSALYPQAKSVGRWLKDGWHAVLAYVLGFFALYFLLGWQPHAPL